MFLKNNIIYKHKGMVGDPIYVQNFVENFWLKILSIIYMLKHVWFLIQEKINMQD